MCEQYQSKPKGLSGASEMITKGYNKTTIKVAVIFWIGLIFTQEISTLESRSRSLGRADEVMVAGLRTKFVESSSTTFISNFSTQES